jgi:hypothetical protein
LAARLTELSGMHATQIEDHPPSRVSGAWVSGCGRSILDWPMRWHKGPVVKRPFAFPEHVSGR